jgi:hypothetical protein
VPQCSGPEMGLGATDGLQFARPSGKPREQEHRYELRSSKRRRDSTSADNRKGNRMSEVKQGGREVLFLTRSYLGICQPEVRGGYQFHDMWDSS